MENLQYSPGDHILIEIWNYKTRQSDWKEGVFNQYVNSLDEQERANVTTLSGLKFEGASLQCIKPYYTTH